MNRAQTWLLTAASKRGWIYRYDEYGTCRLNWLYKLLRPKHTLRFAIARACFDTWRAVRIPMCCSSCSSNVLRP